jgi:hypothetical protein
MSKIINEILGQMGKLSREIWADFFDNDNNKLVHDDLLIV